MEHVILTLGQAALLLASVISVLGLLYVAVWLLALTVRKLKSLQSMDRPVERPTVGGGLRKW